MPSYISSKPIDEAHTLRPSHVLYLAPGRRKVHSEISDLTSYLLSSYTESITPAFQDSVQRVLRANPALRPTWQATRGSWYSNSSVKVFHAAGIEEQDASHGRDVASLHAPILAFGTTSITFPPSSEHSSHTLTVSPVSMTTRAQAFVEDSIPYIWEPAGEGHSETASPSSECLSLYKADSTKRIEVARYASQSGKFEVGGILLVQEGEVDVVMSLVTLLGVLNQRDSLRRPRDI